MSRIQEQRHLPQRGGRSPLPRVDLTALVIPLALGASILWLLGWPAASTIALIAALVLLTAGLLTSPPAAARGGRSTGPRDRGSSLWLMALVMSPAILLGSAFPLVADRLAPHAVAGVRLETLILSASVAVPWLSQVVGTPVYRLLGSTIPRGPDAVRRHYCEVWPGLLLLSIAPAMAVTACVGIVTGWGAGALAAHFALIMAHVVFVQSLVVADLGSRRHLWALGWLAYAIALLIAPDWWLAPPLAGALSQILAIGTDLRALARPRRFAVVPVIADMGRGLILGGVLWADKLLLFITVGRQFDVSLVYLCLQPAVLAYSYYFAIASPRINQAFSGFHDALENEPMSALHRRGAALRRMVTWSLARMASVGSAATLVVVALTAILAPGDIAAVTAISAASLLLAILTLLAYEIDHAGDSRAALALSGIAVVLIAASFAALGGVSAYGPIALTAMGLSIIGALVYHRRWSAPEYAFFWGKALSW